MTRPRPEKPSPLLCVLSEDDCSALFGKGGTWFRERETELEAQGFPKYDPLLDGRNAHLVEQWFKDRQSPVEGAVGDDGIQHRLEAMQNGR